MKLYILGILIGFWIGFMCFDLYFMPKKLDKRAKSLGLMKYNSETDSFEPKGDTVVFDYYLLHYLKYGTYKNIYKINKKQ
jgi:hypothetical protein